MNSSQVTFILTLKIIISIKKMGPQGQNMIPMCGRKKHLWDARHEPSSPAYPRLQRWAHQTEALSQPFKVDICTCGLLVVFLEKIGPSTPHRRPEYREQKSYETRGVSPRAQIKSIYSGEHIKRKLLMNPSKIILTLRLKLIVSTKKLGSKGKI